MGSVHIGLIGAGAIGNDHLTCLRRNKQVGAVAVFDEDHRRAETLAAKHGAAFESSLQRLIERSDLIWVSTPPFAHRPVIEAACAAGKAIFCEKPLAHSLTDAAAIRDAVLRSRVPFFMGHSGRYSAPFVLMKQLVQDGAIGRPASLFSTRCGWLDRSTSPAWRINDELSGGAIVELGIHEIDFIRWVGGEWTTMCALGSSTLVGPQFQDSVLMLGTLSGGANARVDLSWANPRYIWERGVWGTEGSLYVNDSDFNTVQLHRPGREPELLRTNETDWMDRTTGENLSLRDQAAAVLNALAEQRQPPVTLEDGYAALATAIAARRSITQGQVQSTKSV